MNYLVNDKKTGKVFASLREAAGFADEEVRHD